MQKGGYNKNIIVYLTLDLKRQNKHRILLNKKLIAKQENIKNF